MELFTYYQDINWDVGILEQWEESQEEILMQKTIEQDPRDVEFINSCGIKRRKQEIFYILNWSHEDRF